MVQQSVSVGRVGAAAGKGHWHDGPWGHAPSQGVSTRLKLDKDCRMVPGREAKSRQEGKERGSYQRGMVD